MRDFETIRKRRVACWCVLAGLVATGAIAWGRAAELQTVPEPRAAPTQNPIGASQRVRTARCTSAFPDRTIVSTYKAPNMHRVEDDRRLVLTNGKTQWLLDKEKNVFEQHAAGPVDAESMFSVDADAKNARKVKDYVVENETTTTYNGKTYPVLETSIWFYHRGTGTTTDINSVCDQRVVAIYDPHTRLKLHQTVQRRDDETDKLFDLYTSDYEYDIVFPSDTDQFVFKPPAGANLVANIKAK